MMSRYKPKGWQYESHRHMLARKGIKTKFKPYHGHLEEQTLKNTDYRRVIFTGKNSQLVLMDLHPKEEIGKEVHPDVDQFFRIEQGKAQFDLDGEKNIAGPGDAVVVPAGTYHNVINKSDSDLKLYTIYSPPEHPAGTVEKNKLAIPIMAESLKEGTVYPISPEEIMKILGRMDQDDLKGLKSIEFVEPKTEEQRDAWAQYVRSKRVVYVFSQPVKNGKIDGQDPKQLNDHIQSYVIPHELGHHKALYHDKITDKNIAMAEARADANVVGMAPDDKDVKIFKALHE